MLPHELLDDGQAVETCRLLVLGCGNILRGDDAVGPILVRHLWRRGVPAGVRLVDGGTSGMDVAFGMRGAERVVIVDAAATGAEPGTVYRVPGSELEDLPDLSGLHTHNFRWDHALAFSKWLLGPEAPTDVTVFLVEAENVAHGAPLSPRVDAGMRRVIDILVAEFLDEAESFVQVTADGYLRMSGELATHRFPASVCGARLAGERLQLIPLASQANGGSLLKQRNAAGERSLLVRELADRDIAAGRYAVSWDDEAGALEVVLDIRFATEEAP